MNTLLANWPPVESASVGFKIEHIPLRDRCILSLKGLGIHPYAWWYGCRFVSEELCEFRVSLRREDENGCLMGEEWTQRTGEWRPLPWLLPGSLADSENVYLDVQPIGNATTSFFAATAAYIEMPSVQPLDRFLFVNEDGRPVGHWNHFRREFGTPEYGFEPVWKTIHTVIPPLQSILESSWRGTDVFCIHDWSEYVSRMCL